MGPTKEDRYLQEVCGTHGHHTAYISCAWMCLLLHSLVVHRAHLHGTKILEAEKGLDVGSSWESGHFHVKGGCSLPVWTFLILLFPPAARALQRVSHGSSATNYCFYF